MCAGIIVLWMDHTLKYSLEPQARIEKPQLKMSRGITYGIVMLMYLTVTLFRLELLRPLLTLVPQVTHKIILASNFPAFM